MCKVLCFCTFALPWEPMFQGVSSADVGEALEDEAADVLRPHTPSQMLFPFGSPPGKPWPDVSAVP